MKLEHIPTTNEQRFEMVMRAMLQNLLALSGAMQETEDLQWITVPTHLKRKQMGHTGSVADSEVPDPTGDAAVDEARLKLRSARRLATLEIDQMVKRLDGLLARFDRAIEPYKEDPDETR